MALPSENLDDKTFDELVREAIARIPIYAPEWTDQNIHDPGLTFIELFAWLVEMQIYRLNRIPEGSYKKFLKLLGIPELQRARQAKVDVTFSLIPPHPPTLVPAGTQVAAPDPVSGKDIIFETEHDDLHVVDAKLKAVLELSRSLFLGTGKGIIRHVRDLSVANETENMFYSIFEYKEYPKIEGSIDIEFPVITKTKDRFSPASEPKKPPEEIDLKPEVRQIEELYLGFDKDLTSKKVTLAWDFYEEDVAKTDQYSEELVVFPSVTLRWEYCIGEDWEQSGSWSDKFEIFKDETRCLTVSGKMRIEIEKPKDKENNMVKTEICGHSNLFWLRCRVAKGKYEMPPKIDRIRLNTISAIQRNTVKDCTFSATGLPNFSFELKQTPVISVEIQEDNHKWSEVEDFDASKPGDRHYTVDSASGRVTFGNGLNGKIPPKGVENIIISYSSGGGIRGNVEPHAINSVLGELAGKVTVDNQKAASGGAEAETLQEAILRVRKDIKTIYRAVTSADYEFLALNTPGIKVAKARAIPRYHPIHGRDREIPGIVTVVILPQSSDAQPKPGAGFLKTVYNHLDKHRLLTTELFVIPPEYVEVSVDAEIVVKPQYLISKVENDITTALEDFLHPLTGGADGQGWPFGRSVYRSEIYEIIDQVEGVDYVASLKLKQDGDEQMGHINIPAYSLVYSQEHTIRAVEEELHD